MNEPTFAALAGVPKAMMLRLMHAISPSYAHSSNRPRRIPSSWARAALEKVGARVSAVVVDLSDLSVVARRNAEARLTPASLTKLTIGT